MASSSNSQDTRLSSLEFGAIPGEVTIFCYNTHMTNKEFADGTVHKIPVDLKGALVADRKALATWEDITPLARNEWICWGHFR